MKKLMVVAAAAAASYVACAAQSIKKDCYTTPTDEGCPAIVFKLTASGKVTADMGDYKSVKALKISKGALILLPGDSASEDACCYDYVTIAAQVKANKTTYKLAILDQEITKWSVFGKNLAKAEELDAGKSTTLETDLGFAVADDAEVLQFDDNENAVTGVSLWATGFGTMKYALSKATSNKSVCNPKSTDPCLPVMTWKNYKGWFAGSFDLVNDNGWCATCECPEKDLFGGTWTATFQKKLTSAAAAVKNVFGVAYEDAAGDWADAGDEE